MAYLELWAAAHDEQFIRRVALAANKTAWYIAAEAANAPDHALRMALVQYAGPGLSNYHAFAREIAPDMLIRAGATLTSTDEQIDAALSGLWNDYAARLAAKGVITVEAA